MNETLERAMGRIARLPEAEQEKIALWLFAELDDEERWQDGFATGSAALQRLADDALAEHERGETRPFPGFDG